MLALEHGDILAGPAGGRKQRRYKDGSLQLERAGQELRLATGPSGTKEAEVPFPCVSWTSHRTWS